MNCRELLRGEFQLECDSGGREWPIPPGLTVHRPDEHKGGLRGVSGRGCGSRRWWLVASCPDNSHNHDWGFHPHLPFPVSTNQCLESRWCWKCLKISFCSMLIYFLKNSGAGSRCCPSARCSAVLRSVGSLLTKQNISEWRYMALTACCALFCRWEWILLGQREAPVSHHDGIPAQPWSPHAVGAVEPWERTPAQPSAAEPPAHQQYVWGPAGEQECLQPCWELGLPSFPASVRGKWWETRGWQQGQSFPCLLLLGLMSRPLSATSASPSDCSLLEKSLFNGFGTASL